jgi:predicted membrane chloride channel (bestrophin family)
MNLKKITSFVLGLLLIASVSVTFAGENGYIQREEVKKLAPKYRAFLVETQGFMRPQERRVFMGLKTDKERDQFIVRFWETRKGWDNISTLYLLRMVQVLDLTEEQAAKIFPRVNRVEKEKREINRTIGQLLRELRVKLRQPDVNQEELSRILDELKDLRMQVKNRDEELQKFMEENLTIQQQARYLLFMQDFLKDLREKLNKAREAIK